METGLFYIEMSITIKESGKMECLMAKANNNINSKANIMDNSNKDLKMEKESILLIISKVNILGNSKMDLCMIMMEIFKVNKEEIIMESFKEEKDRVMVS